VFLRRPVQLIRADLRVYLLLNAVVYGLVVIGIIVGVLFPSLVDRQTASLEADGTADLVFSLLSNPWLFAVTILGVNTFRIGLLTILLPSLVVPFGGVIAFIFWTAITGVTIAPTTANHWVALIPHSLTVVIEFQAYILLAFGAFLIGRSWLRPRTVDAVNHRQGYVRGLKRFGTMAIPALALLVIGAIYEAFSLVYLLPHLLRAFGLA
jgi:hypothetical protein